MNKKNIILNIFFLILLFLIIKVLNFDFLLLDYIKKYQVDVKNYVSSNYCFSVLIYVFIYILFSILPIPGDSTLTVIGGFLFGTIFGILYSIISVTLAGIITYLFFRYLFDTKKINILKNDLLKKSNLFFKKYGSYFILVLRILPILPISIVNIIAAFIPISLKTFIWTTVIGMIPILSIYSFAGQKLNNINSLAQIFSIPILLLLFTLVFASLAPLLLKKFK